jgi:hypothetical protein
MSVLVIAGGTTSFGLWWVNHATTANLMEQERAKLISARLALSDSTSFRLHLEALHTNSESLAAFLARTDALYADSPEYKATLKTIQDQTVNSIPDTAIRVTIGVLTVFLVQIFFAIYKYTSHVAESLSSRADALQLLEESPEGAMAIRDAMAIHASAGTPVFSGGPRSPLEEAARLIRDASKRKE